MSPLPPITTIFMPNLLVCRPQVWAEFATAVNLRHQCALRRRTATRSAASRASQMLRNQINSHARLDGCNVVLGGWHTIATRSPHSSYSAGFPRKVVENAKQVAIQVSDREL